MSSFTTPLVLNLIDGTRDFRVVQPFEFYYDMTNGDRTTVKIPAGFVTDLASVPRALWSILDPMDPDMVKACVIHDWGYRFGNLPRALYDEMLLEGMKILGAPRWKQKAVHLAVRTFGGRHWRLNRSS